MKKIEKIIVIVAVIAMILKMCKLQISLIILMFSMVSLSILDLIKAFNSFKGWKVSKAISFFNFMYYLVSFFLIIAIFFLLMFWPNGIIIIDESIKIYFFVTLFGFVYSILTYYKNKSTHWDSIKESFLRCTFLLIISFILGVLPVDVRIKVFALDSSISRDSVESFNR